jgi:hypothetical protein
MCFIFLSVVVIMYICKNKRYTMKTVEKFNVYDRIDFDDVMDKKCEIETDGSNNDYVFGKGYCQSDTCPMETCHEFDDGTNDRPIGWYTTVSEQTKTLSANGDIICTETDIPDNQTKKKCNEPIPVCQNLGDKMTIYEYDYSPNNKKEWVRKEFQKGWSSSGECKWINKDNNDEEKTDFEIKNSRTEPVVCSVSNVLCSQQPSYTLINLHNLNDYDPMTNVLRYIIDPDDETGERCIQDSKSSCDHCERDVKYGYKLNTTENKYERRIYTQRVIDNRCAYFDNQGYCCPQTICPEQYYGVDDVNKYCAFEAPSNLFNSTDIGESCKQLEPLFCSNLDERDYFKRTKFIPRLKSDGTDCEYRSANLEDSRIIPRGTNGGFECWERQRLCKNKDEFRNSALGKCTKCPNGMFLKEENRAEFNESDACTLIANCDDQLETCYIHLNTSEYGTVKKKEIFQKQNDPSDLSQCISHKNKPASCETTCVHDTIGDYCAECVGGAFNPLKERCDQLPEPCEGEAHCMDSHDHIFYKYKNRHVNNNRFNQKCEYYRNVNVSDNVNEAMNYEVTLGGPCQTKCPRGFQKDNTQSPSKCIFPRCTGTIEYTVEPGETNVEPGESNPKLDQGAMSNIYHNLELGGYPHYSNEFCLYTKASRIETLKVPDGFENCYLDEGTKFVIGNDNVEDHNYEVNKIYSRNTPSNVYTKEFPANVCSTDCEFNQSNIGENTIVINDNFTNKYAPKKTVITQIKKINKEATGNGRKCTEYGGTVVWGGPSIFERFPSYRAAINNYNSRPGVSPVESTNKRFLLKTSTTYELPPEISCVEQGISERVEMDNTSVPPEYDRENRANCDKKQKIIRRFKSGTKSVEHTREGWYRLTDCGQDDECEHATIDNDPSCFRNVPLSCPTCIYSSKYYPCDNPDIQNDDFGMLEQKLVEGGFRGRQRICERQTLSTTERCKDTASSTTIMNVDPSTEIIPLTESYMFLTPEPSCSEWKVEITTPTLDSSTSNSPNRSNVEGYAQIQKTGIQCSPSRSQPFIYTIECINPLNCLENDNDSNCQPKQYDDEYIPQCLSIGGVCEGDTQCSTSNCQNDECRCNENDHCPDNKKCDKDDVAGNRCVECTENIHCDSLLCLENNTCAECTEHIHCDSLLCLENNTCAECTLNEHCSFGNFCSTTNYKCEDYID